MYVIYVIHYLFNRMSTSKSRWQFSTLYCDNLLGAAKRMKLKKNVKTWRKKKMFPDCFGELVAPNSRDARTDICKIATNTSHQSYSGALINFEVCLRFAKHCSWLYISSRKTYEWWLRPCSSYWNTFRQIYI